jgi:hypothetical protein
MEQEPKKRGRPRTGVTPKRNVRIGAAWDQGERLAASLNMTMTAYVEQALRRENARAERAAKRTQEPDQPGVA